MTIQFQTNRLRITQVESVSDLATQSILALLTPKVTEHLPSEWQQVTRHELAASWLSERLTESIVLSIKNQSGRNIGLIFVFCADSCFTGQQDQGARIGYVLSEQSWGKGYATELLSGCLDYLAHFTQIVTLLAGVEPTNKASIKVLTKNGFTFDRTEHNSHLYVYRFVR